MIRLSQIDEEFSIYNKNIVIVMGINPKTNYLIDLLNHHKIKINYICDSISSGSNSKIFKDIEVISPTKMYELVEEKNKIAGEDKVVIQLGVDNTEKKLEQQLIDIGVSAVISFEEAWQILNAINKFKLLTKNPDMILAHKPLAFEKRIIDRRFEAFNYMASSYLLEQYLFVCSMEKTGDITLMETFIKNHIPCFFGLHTPEILNKNLILTADKKIKIILGVRDPISQNLSFLYQHLAEPVKFPFIYHFDVDVDNFFKKGCDVQKVFSGAFDNFNNKKHIDYIDNFMNRFKENIIDISQYPFDKEKGYTIIKEDNLEVFIYQLEKLNDITKEISDWVGQASFSELVIGNKASDKWISKSYEQAQEEITFSKKYFDRCYNSDWIRHLYSKDDIKMFKSKWSSHIKN
ncbi:MAG: putative capsular polysaccharide synthesis family protein [bacterium]